MAKIVTITNPLTGQPAQVDQLDHTAQQIDDGLNIARGVSNPNLLDNWYFVNPVNQRGQTSYTGVGYGIDRWKLNGATVTVTVVDGEIQVIDNSTDWNGIIQLFENWKDFAGKTVTLSALGYTVGVGHTLHLQYGDNTSIESKPFPKDTIGLVSFTVKIPDSIDSKFKVRTVRDGSKSGNSTLHLKAIKLELGTTQTLAHQDENGNWVLNEIPDYGEQLARCQRNSCILFDLANYGRAGFVVAESSDVAHLYIPTPVTMREIPSLQILHGSISDLYLAEGGSYTPISGVSCTNKCAGYLDILLNTSGLTEGNIYVVRGKENRVCILAISEL